MVLGWHFHFQLCPQTNLTKKCYVIRVISKDKNLYYICYNVGIIEISIFVTILKCKISIIYTSDGSINFNKWGQVIS